MIQLPEQPWQEGDDFTVEETGVRYVYDGEKWLSESGEAADLSGFATRAFVDEIESASVFRDEAIKADLEDKDRKQTAAILVVEGDVQNEAKNRRIGDDRLQEQIDALAAGDVDLSPVEDRLDEIEAVLPKTPAVIDPVEIGGQALKITGNRPSGAGGEAGSVLMWKAEAGSGGSPYNECKLVVPDTSVIDPNAASIWWKQGDKVQRWDMGGNGWFTSGNVLHYSAKETFGDTLIDGQPIDLFYVDPALTGDDFVDAISRVESKADDRKLQVEIEEIALALETLLVQKEHGQWKYIGFTGDNIPRNAGEFGLAVADIGSSQDNIITINQEDLKGITHGFADVDVGDYIEIVNVDEPSSYALFVVTKAPEGTGIVNVEVALKDTGYNIWNGETCEIRFFAINEQDLNLTDLDNRYLKLSGGTMKGDLNLSGSLPSIGYTDDQGQNWVQFRFGTATEYKGWYNSDDAIATRKTVQEQIDAAISASPSKSIATAQMMLGAYTYWDMPAGRFTLVRQDGTSPTISPTSARGFRFYPSPNEWWLDSHELIAGGYISIFDPYTGKMQFAGRVESVVSDNNASNRWTFMMPNDRYQWGDNLNSDGQFLITLSGCLREK